MITIKKITEDKKEYLDLLLLADPEESMVDKYLHDGEMFVLFEGDKSVSEVVIKEIDKDICELKNVATSEEFQGRGYASRLIKYVYNEYRDIYKEMQVGTADKGVAFYERIGFKKSHIIKNFFIDNYKEPIYEDGVQCINMIYLSMKLQ